MEPGLNFPTIKGYTMLGPASMESKTLFIPLQNKYTTAMNYASIGRIERRSLGMHMGSFLQVPPRPEAGEAGGWDNGEAYALALRGG